MNPTTTRSARDTAFAGVSVLVAGVLANRLGLSTEEAGLLNIVVFGIISFGYRAARYYLPWFEAE